MSIGLHWKHSTKISYKSSRAVCGANKVGVVVFVSADGGGL